MDRVLVVEIISLLNSLIVAVEMCYKAYQTRQRRLADTVAESSRRLLAIQRLLRASKRRKDCRLWESPGSTAIWWENFKNGLAKAKLRLWYVKII